jgi:PAS domain S-box-containing protein
VPITWETWVRSFPAETTEGASTFLIFLRTGQPKGVGDIQLTDGALAGLLDSAPIAMLVVDDAGLIVFLNAEAELLFGYPRQALIGEPVDPLISIGQPELPTSSHGLEMPGRRRDGTEFSAAIALSTLATNSGQLISATIRDVSERIEVEAEAEGVRVEAEAERVKAEQEKKVAERVRLEAEADRVTAEGEKTVAERVRLEAEADRVAAEGEKREAERVRLDAEADRVTAEGERIKAEVEKLEAERVRLQVEAVRVTAEGEKEKAEIVHQEAVAERGRLEAQLHQSQRMESLGQLAGGVAHDFNNLLAVILNYASFVAEELSIATSGPSGTKWEGPLKDVEQIQLAAERASVLTHQLLAFARREVVQARPLSLNSAITRMEQILRRTIGEQIELVTGLAVGLPMVVADPGQIEQIVLNLAINARDAMPDGGTLSIDTSLREVVDDEVVGTDAPPGSYVCCRVSDNGTGMSTEVRDRAYEPFFTTKTAGEGSGLGLATVYGIVSQSGGFTRIYSDEGVGTSITILLPAAVESEAPIDLDAVREVTRRILTRNGYTVVTASGGAQAIEIATSFDKSIDLLLTDVIMPSMLGPTVAIEVRKLRPDIRVLYMSGHAHPVLAAESVLDTDFLLVEKPFDQAMLLESVRTILERDD